MLSKNILFMLLFRNTYSAQKALLNIFYYKTQVINIWALLMIINNVLYYSFIKNFYCKVKYFGKSLNCLADDQKEKRWKSINIQSASCLIFFILSMIPVVLLYNNYYFTYFKMYNSI